MAFWDSKPCRITGGLAIMAAVILTITAMVFDYKIAEWDLITWGAVGFLVASLFVCCCIGGSDSKCQAK